MSSMWRKCRVVRKEYDNILNELGLARLVAGPSSVSLSNDRAASTTFTDSARVAPLSPPKLGSSRQSGNSISTDAGGEPPLKLLKEQSGSEALVNSVCGQGAHFVEELQSEIVDMSSREHSDSDSSSSDNQISSKSWDESDDFVASDSCTGRDEGTALTCSAALSRLSPEQMTASEEFAVIASKHNMTHACINDVFDFCRRRGFSDLPKDARTVLRTERKAQVEQNGSFVHFGLAAGIRQVLPPGQVVPSERKLQGNIDGVPLYRSSQLAFWPILCLITNVEASPPFVVSVYCGAGKPPSLQDYLEPFVREVSELASEGLSIGDVRVQVSIEAMVCDAPARSYVKCIVGHTGYCACERCNQKGRHIENRVTFPKLHAPTRTNASFRSQENKRHHSGFSPFLSLDVDMIAIFPSEYMHLVCLGVMRRLLKNWVCQSHSNRLSRLHRCQLNESLREASKAFPTYFQGKPRGTEELDRWKATEFRTFLLHVGPVVLKPLLPPSHYKHFLMFHVAIRILASPQYYCEYNDFAKDVLRYFVQEFSELYGRNQLVYNVHSLIHLADQCRDHGPLDQFSAFPFESYLGRMKKLLRSSNKPLSQLSRMISELRHSTKNQVEQKLQHVKPGDCFLIDSAPVVVLEIMEDYFKGGILPNARDFFKHPLKSSQLNIWRCNALSNRTKVWPLDDLRNTAQCLRLNYKQGHVVVPLLHFH
ncbi:uncharacterized protein LOC142570615 [Dermacentor variabilis]|uniref:uncharacterized protein LOC142570615 n=1 Tax=Dermacentor variabilis TaxID=34621 RepID=UPI003F5AE90D